MATARFRLCPSFEAARLSARLLRTRIAVWPYDSNLGNALLNAGHRSPPLALGGIGLGQLLDLGDCALVQALVELHGEMLLRDGHRLDGVAAQLRAAEAQHARAAVAVANRLGHVGAERRHTPGRR